MSEQTEGGTNAFWRDTDDDVALRRYRTLVNTVDDGIYQLDSDGRFVAVNDVIVEMCGYPREELIGESVTLLLEDDDVERIGRDIYRRLESDEPLDEMYEFEAQTADGESIPCELRMSLLVEDGAFRGTIGVVRDISNRKRQKEQIETALESYETITSVLDEADVGVFVLDEQCDVAWVDETAQRYFGIDRDAVIGRDQRELVEETLRDRVADGDAFADTLLAVYEENEGAEHFEYRVTSDSDHEARWLEHRSKPIESGRYAGGRVELCYDITEQHRRAHQLRQLNEAVHGWLKETSREAVADQATRDLRDILKMEINGIFFYDPTLQELRPTSWTETAETVFGGLPTFGANEGIAWRVFESKQPEVYGDVTEASDVYDPDTPAKSEIVLPVGEHGVVIIGSRQSDAFDDGDLMLAKIVASNLETMFDRLHHERRLERERDLTDQILDVTPVGTLVLDADGEVTRINERAAELLDIDDPDTFGPGDRPKYDETGTRLSIDEQPFAKALSTGKPVYDHILQVERPDGERRWLSINAVPITDENGEVDCVVTTSEDVTDLKDHERTLKTELDEIFGRVSDAFYGLDEEFRFTHVNDRAEKLLQHSEDDLLGERLWDVFPEAAEADDVWESFHAAMDTQKPTSYERYVDLLGFWVEANIYPSATGVSVYFRDITERKEREQELQLFRNLIDQSNDSVLVIDPDTGEVRDVNDTACDRLGYDRADLLELSVTDIETGFPDREAWRAHVEDVRTEGALTVEGEHRRADGTVVPVEVNVSYVELDREYMIAIARDVTERKERESELAETIAELQESEERLRLALEAGEMGTWELDLETEGSAVRSPHHDRIFGYEEPLDDWGFETFLDHVHPDDREEVRRSFEEAFETGTWKFECRIARADGERRVISARGEFHFDGDDEPVRAVGVVQDVTDRKEREHELERALDLLEKTERIADVAGWEVDPETNEPYWTDHLFDMLDVSYDEQPTLDEALDVYYTEEDRATVEDAVEAALESGQSFDVVTRFPRPSGDVGRLRVQGEPETENGEVVSLRGAVQDVTEQVERERQLEELVEKLEESNERLEQFAYAASHDLQEPLRMVTSYLQLLENRYGDALDEDGEEFLEFAVDGADRMREMIDGLLEYSRVDTRGNPFERVDLQTVLEDTLENLQVRVEETNAEITAGSLPQVRGDASQLRQVFQNLLSNAIEYSGDEPPRIHVSAEREEGEWRLAVRDEGIGIDSEQTDRIFNVFQRLHTHDEHAGTGIGLALCQRIVERHGGDIWVDSEPGEGSTFYFTLPATE